MQHSQKSPPVQPPSHRRSLHRTLSDESIYRGQRLPSISDSVTEPTLSSDVLFSCSTLPRSPTTRGVPLRRPSYKLGVKLHGKKDRGWKCLCRSGLRALIRAEGSFIEPQYSTNDNLQLRETVSDRFIFVFHQVTFRHLTRHWWTWLSAIVDPSHQSWCPSHPRTGTVPWNGPTWWMWPAPLRLKETRIMVTGDLDAHICLYVWCSFILGVEP